MADAPPARSPPPCILVVDGDAAYREFLRLLLGGSGYAVRLAGSPREARAALRPVPPRLVICDLVIYDVRTPGAPPFAVLDQLAQDPATVTIPVLVCSGAVRELAEAGARLGRPQVRTLAKPFDIDALLNLVAAMLRDAGTEGTPSP